MLHTVEMSSNSPLGRVLLARGLTQADFAKVVGCSQSSVCRAVSGRVNVALAAKVVDALDPGRAHFNELLLLYPERYPDWQPPAELVAAARIFGDPEVEK
jgi:transcriptional regulator with XRE-family HTH domain